MKINLHDLHAQYVAYQDEIDHAVKKVFNSSQFIMGPEVFEFENALAAYLDCQHVITCSSGTDALLLSLLAIDIKPGDEVITTPFTFIATAEVIALLGAKPVFADIQEDTYNIDPQKILEKITSRTRAIIPVSLYGQPADMDEINTIAKQYSEKYNHKIYVIEDAAQSLGATYKEKKSSNLSDIGCVSFFPTKPLGCYGDGGAVIVNNEHLAEKIKMLRVHGQSKRYYHQHIGMCGRLDTVQAAILQVKLKYLEHELVQRTKIAANYNELLLGVGITSPKICNDRTSVFAQYSIRIKNRNEVVEHLSNEGICSAVHYPRPLHLQECFAYLNYAKGDFPCAERISTEILSLPMSAFVTEHQQQMVVDSLKKAVSQSSSMQYETEVT